MPAAAAFDRILVARVPRAGVRWSQVHFNRAVIAEYFRITDLVTQRVYLAHVDHDGNRGEEEVRPCVYAKSNKNPKIEIAAAKTFKYPTTERPIVVFRERQVRCFDYMLLMPGQSGHAAMSRLLETLPSIGGGFQRAITDIATLASAWLACPLLTVTTEVEKEI